MFEDQNQQKSNSQSTTPANLPFGQPQSPFVPPQPQIQAYSQPPQSAVPQPGRIDDMFAETDRATANQSGNPAAYSGYPQDQHAASQYPQPAQPVYYQAGASPMADDLFGRRGLPWGKILTFLIIILVLGGGAGAAYWGYKYFSSGVSNPKTNVNVPSANNATTSNNTSGNKALSTTTAGNVTTTETTAVTAEENRDSDGDGLTDSEEKSLGTKPEIADTDSDGLTDWAETKIYKTDPLNPDTDGDTYKDGQEVINGYDPTKPGSAKLYEVPKNGTTTSN